MVGKPILVEKLFVLGCSGSGKSTISRHIAELVQTSGWNAYAINDYQILYEMFQADKKHEKFQPAAHNGFDVLNMSVYDTALDELNKQAQRLMKNAKKNELIIVEFARCDYKEALKHFDDDFLHAAHFLFLDVDIEACKQRVRKRVTQWRSLDDHFVPDDVIECFGQESCKQYIEYEIKQDYDLADHRVQILDTRRSIEEVTNDVKQFIANLLPVLVSIDS